MVGIPLCDPKLIAEGVALEPEFIDLRILSAKKIRYILILNIAIVT